MPELAISIENLGKMYRIGHRRQSRDGLRHLLQDKITSPWRRLTSSASESSATRDSQIEEFWALKDISFDVPKGEVVGIIGRNGAGKSTLLKIFSRITEPTRGRVRIRGRVASLLEVGTGFHQELTGRENIFLNGAILVMTKEEIRNKFDEIVAFAEIERFLDTPVKRYSSGMYVRLAFAVAAHLEPEILIVDEVLAVGDLQFQRKCMGKMQSVATEGRTILFVSHNMGVVANLCERVLLLHRGRLVSDGDPADVITAFVQAGAHTSGQVTWPRDSTAANTPRVSLLEAQIISGGSVTSDVRIDEEVVLRFTFEIKDTVAEYSSSVHLFDKEGTWVLCSGTLSKRHSLGIHAHEYTIPANFLNNGMYMFSLILLKNVLHQEVHAEKCISFVVHETGVGREQYGGTISGCIRPHLTIRETPLSPAMQVKLT
jgi:lipopolysaccharide transport system ATP-binding protein